MITPLIAGNWKMNGTTEEGVELVLKLRGLLKGIEDVEVVVAPPFTTLYHLKFLLADSPINLAAQDLFWENKGSYTGEVSAAMLTDVGCNYVIIGHSERRQHFGETDNTVRLKTAAALAAGLGAIVCVGETLEEREAGKALGTVRRQVRNALTGEGSIGPGAMKDVTVAYEPVWAIGTGAAATTDEAEEVHSAIRELLFELFGPDAVKGVRIIYGGSVKPGNIDSLMAQPNIDGALVGGASLVAEDFARIVSFKGA